MDQLTEILGYVIYGAQALAALWGVYCLVLVWRRLGRGVFRNEDQQNEFMEQVEVRLANNDFNSTLEVCEGDQRVISQLISLAVNNRDLGYGKVRKLVGDRFQRDVLSQIDYRVSWILTVIKTAPMLGLFGTVGGMMGAFSTLAAGGKTDGAKLAEDISLALVTTVVGLAITIPLMFAVASVNVRIKKLEELVGLGLEQFLDAFKPALERAVRRG